MNEKPILFNTEMVGAILEGRKTQTRRIVKENISCCRMSGSDIAENIMFVGKRLTRVHSDFWNQHCPYGQVGDKLWVREKFNVSRPFTGDMDHDFTTMNVTYYASDVPKYRDKDKWKPSIHMPKKYARIWLEITVIRAERLHDMRVSDIRAEGGGR